MGKELDGLPSLSDEVMADLRDSFATFKDKIHIEIFDVVVKKLTAVADVCFADDSRIGMQLTLLIDSPNSQNCCHCVADSI